MREVREHCLVGQTRLWSQLQPQTAMAHMAEEDLQSIRPKGPSFPPSRPASTHVGSAGQGIVLSQFSVRFWLSCSFGSTEVQAMWEHLCLTATRGQILCWLTELLSGSTALSTLCGTRDLFLSLIISAEKLHIYQIFCWSKRNGPWAVICLVTI